MHIHWDSWISHTKATFLVGAVGSRTHITSTTVFRDKGQSSAFLPCLFPSLHPYKDKVSRVFFNLLFSNWWEKVAPLISALSWRDLIRSNDQINREFWVRTFGTKWHKEDYVVIFPCTHCHGWGYSGKRNKALTRVRCVYCCGVGGRESRGWPLGHGGEVLGVKCEVNAKMKWGWALKRMKIFDSTTQVILPPRLPCLQLDLFPKCSVSLWPWCLSHPWGEPHVWP